MMARIFVSYGHTNKPFVEELVKVLERVYSDHKIWFDADLSGGEDWWQCILGEIASCDLFLLMVSNDALESEYCQAEFHEALRLQKLCLPVIVHPKTNISVAPSVLEQEIRRREWVDISGGFRDYQANARLYAAINRLLSRTPPEPLPPLSSVPVSKPDISVIQMLAVRKGKRFQNLKVNVVLGLIGMLLPILIIAVIVSIMRGNSGAATVNPLTIASSSVMTEVLVTDEIPLPTPMVDVNIGGSLPNMPEITDSAVIEPSSTTEATAEAITLTTTPSEDTWVPVVDKFNGVEIVKVPMGCFNMGNDPEAFYWNGTTWIQGVPDGGPQCFGKSFWIDRYEVTNEQFMRLGGIAIQAGEWPDTQQPRTNVTWFEARDFCEKNRASRLPTEVEWEYAARGPNHLTYPWGNKFEPNNVIYSANSNSQAAPVGSVEGGMSWTGAYDMSGNVWEWVRTMNREYPYNTRDGREVETSETDGRVLRGGSWYNDGDAMRSATRLWSDPNVQAPHAGFRCAHS